MPEQTQTVVEQVAGLSQLKTAGRPKRKATGAGTPIQRTCADCGASFKANKVPMDDGTFLITPTRCDGCQTAHLTNLRVNHTIKQIRLLGNLKSRLTPKEREAVTSAVNNELQVLLDRYAGTATSVSGFNLKAISVEE